ncbi:MAG: hypothetical protein O3B47_03465, partial [bacterium]|nr:hypothetical protein [bacterium]
MGASVDSGSDGPHISVSDIVSEIEDPDGLLDDGSFVSVCEEVLELADRVRISQGYIPHDNNQRIALVYEFFRVLRRVAGRVRRDGESVF